MSIVEELIEVMEKGASAMFIEGFIVKLRQDPDIFRQQIDAAAEIVRNRREVWIKNQKWK